MTALGRTNAPSDHSFLSAVLEVRAVEPKAERGGREVRITLAKWVGTATGCGAGEGDSGQRRLRSSMSTWEPATYLLVLSFERRSSRMSENVGSGGQNWRVVCVGSEGCYAHDAPLAVGVLLRQEQWHTATESVSRTQTFPTACD